MVKPFLKQIGRTLSRDKMFREGFGFLGFEVKSRPMTMRVKSVEKSRALTVRSHNLDVRPIEKLNAVMRGVSRYFGTHFSTCKTQLCDMDQWLRMRLKQKSRMANCRSRIRHLRRRGFVFL